MITRTISRFFRRLVGDTRGEDLTESSSALSRGGKVVAAGLCITALGGGTAALANNANSAGDTTSAKINGTVGAQASTAEAVKNPFGGGK